MSTKAIVVKPEENMKLIVGELQKPTIQQQVSNALSSLSRWVTPEKMIRVAMTAIRGDEKLAMSTPVSIVGSVIQLAQVGLVPDGFLGQAYLVPYWNKHIARYEASPLIGYRGYGELAVRSGKATSVDGHVVFAGDVFDFEQGSNPFLRHRPTLDPKKRGEMICAYAIVFMKEGPNRFEVMALDEIMKVRDASQGADSDYSPWKKWFQEMARKSPMRRLAKWVPLSPEFQMAAGIDEAAEFGLQKTVIDGSTGQVLFVPQGEPAGEPAKPGRASEQTANSSAKSEASVSPSQPQKGEAQPSTATQSASPATSGCICNCCKAGKCDCAGRDEMEQCGCTPCQTAVKTPGPSSAPPVDEVFGNAPSTAAMPEPSGDVGSGKPSGPYVPQEKLKRLFVHCASAGIEVKKDSHDDQLHAMLKAKWNIDSLKEIPVSLFETVLGEIAPNLKASKKK